jgi:transposase InsO family protein
MAHVAKAMGISRACVSRWVHRYRVEGRAGLEDRSSRPLHCPRATPPEVVAGVLEARSALRSGPAPIARATGVPERTVSRILARAGVARLAECDPITGQVIRASRATALRYERSRPGELVHVDVKKLGRVPEGGGWRTLGRETTDTYARKARRIGYDYVHSAVDDHTRLAYSEVLADERGATCARFIERAVTWFEATFEHRVQSLITDNHLSYKRSAEVAATLERLGVEHLFIRPHCPWQNGKVERFNRTLQIEWAYRQPFASSDDRTRALGPWLWRYNNERPHSSLGGRPPISRVRPT